MQGRSSSLVYYRALVKTLIVCGTKFKLTSLMMSRKSPGASMYDRPVAIDWRFHVSIAAPTILVPLPLRGVQPFVPHSQITCTVQLLCRASSHRLASVCLALACRALKVLCNCAISIDTAPSLLSFHRHLAKFDSSSFCVNFSFPIFFFYIHSFITINVKKTVVL